MNIQIPRAKVKRSVNQAIGRARRRARRDPNIWNPSLTGMVNEERFVYAKVRVVGDTKGYRLVYPGTPAGDGTGPFKSLAECHGWFIRGGR